MEAIIYVAETGTGANNKASQQKSNGTLNH